MSGVVSRWLGSIDKLEEISERLLRVQIENRPYLEVLDLYDDDETLFYCDPPYVHDSRGDSKAYSFEMTDAEHEEFAEKLNDLKAKVAVSGYKCDLYDRIFKHWRRIEAQAKSCHSVKKSRTECLWINY